MLFGDKFQHYITETVKTSQKSEKLFKLMSKGKLQPFRRGPPTQKNCSGGVESAFRKDQVHIAELHQPAFTDEDLQVKARQKKKLFCNILPELIPQGKIHSVVIGLFLPETLPKVKLAGIFTTFIKEMEGTKWGKKFGNCARLQNPISRGSNPGQGSSQSKKEYRSIHFSESRNRKDVTER